ncbi:MAG TPA: diguanylate cyclase [Dehalococcoidia bacterium]|nr:diguanylate cyclase [Dehalococcoidia bacterium]
MNLWAVIPLISCLAFTALFILVLQQARRRVDKVFALFLLASGIWSFTSFMLVRNPQVSSPSPHLIFWNVMVIVAIPWVTICYYHFVRAYNNKPGGIVVYIGYTFVLAILGLGLAGYIVKDAYMIDGYLYHDIAPWDYVLAGILVPFLALIILMLVRRYRSSTNPIDRNRTIYLITGWCILLVISYITPFTTTLKGLPTDHLGNLANALIIAYAISRFHLLDIRFVVRRGLAYFILIIGLLGVYLGTVLLGYRFLPDQPLYTILILASSLALLLALLARPLRYFIQERVDRFFYRETYEHRQILLGFSNKMGNILNLDELASEMLPAVTKALNVTQAKLLFQNMSSGDFITQFRYPEVKGESGDEFRFNADNPIVAWLIKENTALNLEQIDSIPEFKGLWQSEREQLTGTNLWLLFPIKNRGNLVGILALSKKRSKSFYSHEDIELVMSMANQAGILIENAQLYAQATIRANTDGLSGLYNHRYFHKCLEQEVARGSRFGSIFSLIMLDVDLFKSYNDTYGHLAGDQVLRKIGSYIKGSIRTVDMAFRYGGEEFTIILPEAQIDDAYTVAERIRKIIESNMASSAIPITVSLGIANWPSDGLMQEEVIACADAALYQAKQTGRNRTCLSSDILKPELLVAGAELETRPKALSIIYALAATVDAKDHRTYGHSKKVSDYSVVLAQALGLSGDRIATIRSAGLLHDIGKIAIPDSILNKEGPLTEEEWIPIKAHPRLGVEILRHVIDLVNCLPAILHHHERYDGDGYPSGLKGEDIPLEARILTIADTYDAITSARPYHQQLSSQQAFDELKRCAGTQFDPELVDVFCKTMEQTLSTGVETK